MSLIYITGMTGAGKSSTRKELQDRGYEAHDTDEDGITSWHNKITGEATKRPADANDRTKEWYAEHDWNMSRPKIEELAARAKDRPVFLCGITSNDIEMWDLFGKVICLTIDEETLRRRIANRTDNDFGKAPDELSNILRWHKSAEEDYKQWGAVMIDATRPLSEVVDDVISTLNQSI